MDNLCVCGSGILLDTCCLGVLTNKKFCKMQAEQNLKTAHNNSLSKFLRDNNLCMVKGCTEPVTGSHTISEKSQLQEISHKSQKDKSLNVLFLKPDIRTGIYRERNDRIGNSSASVVPLFCNNHDFVMFKPVDEMVPVGCEIELGDVKPFRSVFACAYRSLHSAKRNLEIDSFFLRSKEARRTRAHLLVSELIRKPSINSIRMNSCKIRSLVDSFIAANLSYNKKRMDCIDSSIYSIESGMVSSKDGLDFESIPDGSLVAFTIESPPPFVVSSFVISSIVGAGHISSGRGYASTISTLKWSNGKWAYFVFFPDKDSEENEHLKIFKQKSEHLQSTESEINISVILAYQLTYATFAGVSNIAISKNWWDSLAENDRDSIETIANFIEDGRENHAILSRGLGGQEVNKKIGFNAGFMVSACDIITFREGGLHGCQKIL